MSPQCGSGLRFEGVVEFRRGCGQTKRMGAKEQVVEFGNALGTSQWSEAKSCGICMEQRRNAMGMCGEGSRNMDSDRTHECM
jgi:hypothetical protein